MSFAFERDNDSSRLDSVFADVARKFNSSQSTPYNVVKMFDSLQSTAL